MGFKKADKNLRKHGVPFKEAATVFGDPLSMTFDDPDHSINGQRYITIGESEKRRVLIVAHTDWGGRVRIISARKATHQERQFYEEKD